jgi:hypothetical protein
LWIYSLTITAMHSPGPYSSCGLLVEGKSHSCVGDALSQARETPHWRSNWRRMKRDDDPGGNEGVLTPVTPAWMEEISFWPRVVKLAYADFLKGRGWENQTQSHWSLRMGEGIDDASFHEIPLASDALQVSVHLKMRGCGQPKQTSCPHYCLRKSIACSWEGVGRERYGFVVEVDPTFSPSCERGGPVQVGKWVVASGGKP